MKSAEYFNHIRDAIFSQNFLNLASALETKLSFTSTANIAIRVVVAVLKKGRKWIDTLNRSAGVRPELSKDLWKLSTPLWPPWEEKSQGSDYSFFIPLFSYRWLENSDEFKNYFRENYRDF